MAISRAEKEEQVQILAEELSRMTAVVFTDYRGLTVREIGELRTRLREQDVSYRVVKYTLLRRALERASLKVSLEGFEGPLALAIGEGDVTVPARLVAEFARTNEKLEIGGGILEGELVDTEMIKRLALLPSREELYAKVVGSLAAPMSGLVGVLSNVPRGLVSVLSQYQAQRG